MKTRSSLIFLFIYVLGILTGRFFYINNAIKNNVSESIVTSNIIHSEESCSNILGASTNSKVIKHQNEKPTTVIKNEGNDEYFDGYEWKQKHDESIVEWNNTVKSLFEENFNNPEEIYEGYQKLKSQLKEEHDAYWERIMIKTKISENSFLGNTTFQEDLEGINIRRKYHEKLKRFLGAKIYEQLQEQIRVNQRRRIEEARKENYGAAAITF